MSHSPYLKVIFDVRAREKRVKELARFAKKLDFDTIAVRGVSGMTIGSILAHRMRVPLLIVRKGERSHADVKVEAPVLLSRFLIVDDQIASGTTAQAIYDATLTLFPAARWAGTLLYGSSIESRVVLIDPRYPSLEHKKDLEHYQKEHEPTDAEFLRQEFVTLNFPE